MAHAIRGGESRRHSLILSKAILFWSTFALLGVAGSYAIDHMVDPSADLANLALPNDAQLEGSWTSGPLHLQSSLHDSEMFVILSRTGTHSGAIASFLLKRSARQGPIGFRHVFANRDNGAVLSLSGSVLTLELPAADGRLASRIAFRRF